MVVITRTLEMKRLARSEKRAGRSIGFTPTMGFLHEGHLSLIRRSSAENDVSVVSVFVNPTQFGLGEDLEKYPRDHAADEKKCRESGADVLFMPNRAEIYDPNFQTFVEVTELSRPWCGAWRPGHFRGVATVVLKLFLITLPDRAYFGQKDYQQLQVVTRMTRDLTVDVEIVPCPTVREADGLAMSSRNAYLSYGERARALCLFNALTAARKLHASGESTPGPYLEIMRKIIERESDTAIDYVSLADPDTLEPLDAVGKRVVALLAVRVGKTRLIDNMLLERD
jgi:pantoate--beta-alanine ligase